MKCLTERFRAGMCREVWAELAERRPGDLDDDVASVLRETMSRVRQNLEVIADGLNETGYRFGRYPSGEPVPAYAGPLDSFAGDVLEGQIGEIESTAGAIPDSLKAFWRDVGATDLMGAFPVHEDYLDPLVVYGPEAALVDLRDWEEDGRPEPFLLPLAPDVFHKDDVSGGEPYGFRLPCSRVNPPMVNEWHETEFVSYLRIAILDYGGFPGVSSGNPASPRRLELPAVVQAHVARIRGRLVPF